MKKSILFLIVIMCSASCLYSQNKPVRGKVISEDLETLSFVLIMIDDTVEVGRTNLDGFFEINIPVTTKKILFRDVGLDPTTIEIVDDCDKIEVVMMSSGTYDFISLKRVERKRKKKYKKLPEVHKKAFEKGIFETECLCFKREFEYLYIDKG
uniref:hypothetical protein n=1 Tax=Roseivirga sp. TaxID=1964215 RepID=UPI00404769ED